MTDKTISQLTDGSTVQSTDQIPVNRSGVNYRVVVGTAGTKAATDATKAKLASINGSVGLGNLAIFADTEGTIEDGGEIGAIITDATSLSPVLTSDFIPVVRGGQIFLSTVAAILAASAPPSEGGQLDFSIAGNSGLLAGVL